MWLYLPPLYTAGHISCLPLVSKWFLGFNLITYLLFRIQKMNECKDQRKYFSYNSPPPPWYTKSLVLLLVTNTGSEYKKGKQGHSARGGAWLSNLVSYPQQWYSAQLRKKWRCIKEHKNCLEACASACLLGLGEGFVSWSSREPEVGKVRGV